MAHQHQKGHTVQRQVSPLDDDLTECVNRSNFLNQLKHELLASY